MSQQRQLRIPDSELDFDADLIYCHRGARFTGVAYDDSPGFLESEVSYRDGFQDGTARDWYRSGQLRTEETFRCNLLHGESVKFREDGSCESRRHYELGILTREVALDERGGEITKFELPESHPNYEHLKKKRMLFDFGQCDE